MQQPQKYMFDTCFDAPETSEQERVDDVLAKREAIHRAELEAACAVARQEGFTDGQADMRTSLEAGIKELCEQLAGSFAELLGRVEAETELVRQQACGLALAGAEALSSALIKRQPARAIEALFRDCLSHLGSAPVIEVSVDAMLAEALQQRLGVLAREAGLEGRVVVRGLHGAGAGRCSIRWHDGGADWDLASAKQAVRSQVEGYLQARAVALSQRKAESDSTAAAVGAAAPETSETTALKAAAQ